MPTGKPAFIEGYHNPKALDDGLEDFPFDEIDRRLAGAPEQDRAEDFAVVATAVVQILMATTDGIGTPDHAQQVLDRFIAMRGRAGANCRPADKRWLRSFVETDRQAELLQQALKRIVELCQTQQDGKPIPEKRIQRHPGSISKNLIAILWLAGPAHLNGLGVTHLAKEIGTHKNCLSLHVAAMSRRLGNYRIHAQSKAHNFKPAGRTPLC